MSPVANGVPLEDEDIDYTDIEEKYVSLLCTIILHRNRRQTLDTTSNPLKDSTTSWWSMAYL